MMLHRLGLACLFSFALAPAIQSLLAVVMCASFLVLHLVQQPFPRLESQALQTTLLFCLVVVALGKVFWASLLQSATPFDAVIEAAIAGTDTLCEAMTIGCQYVVPIIALISSYFLGSREKRRKALAYQDSPIHPEPL